MEVIEFYGTRRSGHHAIIGWLKFNFDAKYGKEKVFYLNDLMNNHSLRGDALLQKVGEIERAGAEYLFVSYEDELTTVTRLPNYPTTKYVIVRDIKNNVASRYKAHPRGAMLVDEKFINIWKNHSQFPDKIRYEDFLSNKPVRDAFCQKLGVENLDITNDVNYCSNIGSSFVGRTKDTTENYLNRFSMIELPEHIHQLIDTEEIKQIRRNLNYHT